MGNTESQSVTVSGKSTNAEKKKNAHPSLELLCQKLHAASAAGKTNADGDLDLALFRSVFRLSGHESHATHLPSSPTKCSGGRTPAELCHQAPTPSIGDYLLNLVAARRRHSEGLRSLKVEDFLYTSQEILNTFSENNYCVEMYVGFNTSDSGWHHSSEMDEIHVRHMLVTCYRLHQNLHNGNAILTLEDQYLLNSLVISMMHSKKSITKDDLLSWTYENCPRLFASTHAWLIRALIDEQGPIHANSELNDLLHPSVINLPPELAYATQPDSRPAPPRSDGPTVSQAAQSQPPLVSRSSSASLKSATESLHSDTILCPVLRWLLSAVLARSYFLPAFQDRLEDALSDPLLDKVKSFSQPDHWTLLYNSNNHGLSMNRFQHHIFSYKGQSVMLLELEAGDLYVIACDSEWKESTSRFGGIDALVLEAVPRFRCRESGRDILYLNEWGRSLPMGIILGHDPKHPILKIDSGLDVCTTAHGVQQNIRAIEVWGCSSVRALDQQRSQKKWENKEAAKGQSVSREAASGTGGGGRGRGARAGWQDNPDRLLLEMGGVTTAHNQRN